MWDMKRQSFYFNTWYRRPYRWEEKGMDGVCRAAQTGCNKRCNPVEVKGRINLSHTRRRTPRRGARFLWSWAAILVARFFPSLKCMHDGYQEQEGSTLQATLAGYATSLLVWTQRRGRWLAFCGGHLGRSGLALVLQNRASALALVQGFTLFEDGKASSVSLRANPSCPYTVIRRLVTTAAP